MTPYFGGKIRGATASSNITESVLDHMQGQGSQFFSKKEHKHSQCCKKQRHIRTISVYIPIAYSVI